ncbi:MAG: double-strand break repair helicase AddA, partial [Pseudomonadota bacterium]
MSPRKAASEAQVVAARPDVSTWLAANAGSGKTRVLTDRVARLLLDGVPPQRVLCLTYTKAAASEMQNRLFQRLGAWAMLDDALLRDELRNLGFEGELEPETLKSARTLFARAIETPGGLKIQTIHSFCASLLRRFPLEAGVSPQFTEIEDRAADLLRAEIVDQMADGGEADLIADLARYDSGDDFDDLTRAIVRFRSHFTRPLSWPDALAVFNQPGDLCPAQIAAEVFQGNERALFDQMIPVLLEKGGNDENLAIKMQALGQLDLSDLPKLESLFLYGSGASQHQAKVPGTSRPIPTKPSRDRLADLMPQLDAFMQRIETARPQRIALLAARRTYALHRFAARFLPLYEDAKTLRGWLDFDDLIERARSLLSDEKVAAWVLFRIDGGIDHILVDEAQDTSPAQWDVIRKLAAEFTSGQGARADVARTIFVVGDKKQSIYSFQGADPRAFDEMQMEFSEKITAAQNAFQSCALAYSFRSASAVLELVDATFAGQQDAGFQSEEEHIAFRSELPGRVDLWPVVPPEQSDDDRDWFDPIDQPGAQHHTVILARRIAREIKRMIDSNTPLPQQDTPDDPVTLRTVRAGDFLILVQRRSTLFAEIIRACKAEGLPIAGADRLKVGGELAVRDLAALLSFLATPEDSLSLAEALKSPLFGWSEQTLFDLAHRRSQDHLWQALRARADAFPKEMAVLRDLRNNTDFLRPYDLIERILTRHNGRKNLLRRLGIEAEDGINALLSQALAYERMAVPSLIGFLTWMETDDLEIKRQIDSNSDQIRVMTVHGAKGLEAPIVILPDTGDIPNRMRDDILPVGDTLVWKSPAAEMPEEMSEAVEVLKERQRQERMRLLYVALTRAEKWLILATAGDLKPTGDSWFARVSEAAQTQTPVSVDLPDFTIQRIEQGSWLGATVPVSTDTARTSVALEPYFSEPAPTPTVESETISPSELGGAKALPGETDRDEEAAKAYGTLVHLMLEHLSAAAPQD